MSNRPQEQRNFDNSKKPDNKARGNPRQILEKYLALAREAKNADDRIAAENYYQYADHYYRVINTSNEIFGEEEDKRPSHPSNPRQFDNPNRQKKKKGNGKGDFKRHLPPKVEPEAPKPETEEKKEASVPLFPFEIDDENPAA